MDGGPIIFRQSLQLGVLYVLDDRATNADILVEAVPGTRRAAGVI
jgi:hypothetical protein